MSGMTDPWQLDKKVPLALILALLVQMSLAAWWAANMTERLVGIERRTSLLEIADTKIADVLVKNAEALTAIRVSQEESRRSLDRIERNIDGPKK